MVGNQRLTQLDDRGGTRGTDRGRAIGYNAIALPIAAGVFEPTLGLVLRPEIAALTMSGSNFIVAMNARLLKRHRLPQPDPNISPLGLPRTADVD